ncbi:MAG TPA: hypothetical protein VJL84_07960 [Kiloniellales bacterium]|nr:hypothetical protein [Kiloniellales bacterium]
MAFNLIILSDTRILPDRDFREIAKRVRARARDIHAFVATERGGRSTAQWAQLLRPTLFVEIQPVAGLRRWRGTLAAPQEGARGKMAAYRLLEAAGLPVPAWREIVPGIKLDPAEWGAWVVVKPDLGLRGINVEAVRTEELRYRSPEELPADHLGRTGPMLVQRFVPTPDGPSYYRVMTCFGVPLLATYLYTAPSGAPPRLQSRDGPPKVTLAYPPARLADEADILDLARRVHATLPQVPTLGCDFLRDRDTGQLWISEVNKSNVWQFSSPRGIRFQSRLGLDLYGQFGALDRAAEAMIAATRRFAR